MRFWGDNLTSADSANNVDVSKRDHFIFGAGRRRCLGMHIADRTLFFGISRLLWAFDFKRAVDPETNQEIIPDMDELSEGIFVLPKPFQAKIVPRSAHKVQRVREEWAKQLDMLDEEMQWKTVPEGLIWRDYEPAE